MGEAKRSDLWEQGLRATVGRELYGITGYDSTSLAAANLFQKAVDGRVYGGGPWDTEIRDKFGSRVTGAIVPAWLTEDRKYISTDGGGTWRCVTCERLLLPAEKGDCPCIAERAAAPASVAPLPAPAGKRRYDFDAE